MSKEKLVICKNCNASILKKAKVCPNCGVKNSKPFYKKGWFIFIIVIAVFVFLVTITGGKEYENIIWDSLELSQMLPTPELKDGKIKGEVNYDNEEYLSLNLAKMSKEDYQLYVINCKDIGFDVDSEKTSSYYSAYNNDGYQLQLSYYENDKEISVSLSSPEELKDVATDHINDKEDIDENKREEPDDSDNDSLLIDGMRPEFKSAMDSYEKFFDEYIAFMEKYSESDGTDLSLITDYADFMNKYAEYMEELEAWEDEDLNEAETIYFVKVQNRINEKLLEVAY